MPLSPVAELIQRSADANAALMRGDVDRYRALVPIARDFTLMAPVGGTPTRPATVDENRGADGCWQVTGRTLTFDRSTDTMNVKDDRQELRAKWQPKASCQ